MAEASGPSTWAARLDVDDWALALEALTNEACASGKTRAFALRRITADLARQLPTAAVTGQVTL